MSTVPFIQRNQDLHTDSVHSLPKPSGENEFETSTDLRVELDMPVLPRFRVPQSNRAISPLRYPGSKKKILSSLMLLMEANGPMPELFVEPFAGGASVSLGLLYVNAVKKVLIADWDPLVASFWLECGEHSHRLIEDMYDEPVTLDRWDFWRGYDPKSRRELALKCLFLNRTSFSGIMNGSAGPIGGRSQASKYKIDCRFNKMGLAKRIQNFAHLYAEGRILAKHQTWQQTLVDCDQAHDSALVYADPPYIEKAGKLYVPHFSACDHRLLASELLRRANQRWIVSYDNQPLALDLYQSPKWVHTYRVEHNYTMKGHMRRQPEPGREVLFTNLPASPSEV